MTVTLWLDCGLVGLIARSVTRRSGAMVVSATVVNVALVELYAGLSAAEPLNTSPVVIGKLTGFRCISQKRENVPRAGRKPLASVMFKVPFSDAVPPIVVCP